VRIFGILCFAVAMFYGWTAVDAMRTGAVHALGGNSGTEHRREDPQSKYRRYLLARWLYCGGFVTLGIVMHVFAGRFEKLASDAGK
jgi:hypothetical protein